MKRTGRILSLVLLIVVLATSFGFAESLELDRTYPNNGYKNAAIDNFGIKLFFNQDVYNEEMLKENEKCFNVVSEDGDKMPLIIVYSHEENMVLVLADVLDKDFKVKESTKYTLTIDEEFTAANGETLGEDVVVELTTLNQSRAQKFNMLLMFVMFGSIMFFSRKQTDKKEEEQVVVEEKVNPYKVAKETGKSIDEILAEDKAKKDKVAAKEAKKAAKEAKIIGDYFDNYSFDDELEDDYDPYHKRVKGPRPISAGGSTYITGKKAAAEQARHKGTTNPKRGKSGAKNKKKQ